MGLKITSLQPSLLLSSEYDLRAQYHNMPSPRALLPAPSSLPGPRSPGRAARFFRLYNFCVCVDFLWFGLKAMPSPPPPRRANMNTSPSPVRSYSARPLPTDRGSWMDEHFVWTANRIEIEARGERYSKFLFALQMLAMTP